MANDRFFTQADADRIADWKKRHRDTPDSAFGLPSLFSGGQD